ncbi:hypothetical protein NAEGRDRAFT_79250 [Naegleria gruberi]|uniref:Uncharacterized protein n=1 Tax=Naegleria gruberi TaxID=5762 RepID=D2VAU6_NAEGR|nr:uncharacterized protein NAEGRDRAFT_79250 [Naegleria gruberi]EFC46142.1 hypothetical protein NAEGRDRAFT_79250 [Naegleria gruberi]|eukprot:XP_002678886.1 hypothetical protein NAEGRDRAFT_79250 [Naegleria gruberi strain NEG-M]
MICSSSSLTTTGHSLNIGHHHQGFHQLSNEYVGSPSQQLDLNNGGDCHQQQLSTSTTMIHDSPSSTIHPKQQYQSSSVSTCQSNHHNNNNTTSCLNNVHHESSTQSSPPIVITTQRSLAITAPSPSSHAFGTSNLSPFSFNGSSGSRDRAISSPPPLAHMKKHMIGGSSNTPSVASNASPNSNHSSGGSGLTSPNCSDQMNLDDDCVVDQVYEERPRRFSLPSNDLINMPFFRQKPQNLTIFQLFNPDTPINEPEIELKDITGMTVLSHSDCKEQYEMLVEELKEFNLYFSCDNI